MRKKINDGLQLEFRTPTKSNFYRRFKDQFDRLLNQDKQSRDFREMSKVYVPQELVISALTDFVATEKDYCCFLIGLTGIGKSTNLKYFFGFEEPKPLLKNDSLILPILCNSVFYEGIDIRKKIANMVETVCDLVEREYHLSYNAQALYDFIQENKPEVLARARRAPHPDKSTNINCLYEDYKFEYATELLKLYLLQANIRNFIIVVDDVDAIGDWNILEKIVHQSCQVWECLKNNASKNYNVKLLVAERPETHRALTNRITWFSAYIWGEPVYLHSVPELNVLFKKRFDCVTETLGGPKAANLEKWKTAYDTLHRMCAKLSISHHDTITALNNNNVRESLSTIEKVLALGRWLEKPAADESWFETTDEEFIQHVDMVRTLRAIAYQDRDVFIDHEESPIASILYNLKNATNCLTSPYIVKFFLENEPNEARRARSIHIDALLTKLPYIFLFDKTITDQFQATINYFVSRRVLFVSPHDTGDSKLLYLSPRGRILWELLKRNSILLEVYRDELWLDESLFDMTKTLKLNVHDRFMEVLNIVQVYSATESRVIEQLKTDQARDNYFNCFGGTTISEQISAGLFYSMRKYYGDDRPEVLAEKFTETVGTVESLKNHVKNIRK